VVIPCHDQGRYVGEALASVQAQTHPAIEVVVVDDGSTDETPEVLRQVRDPRLRVLTQGNRGLPAARNAGIALARGDYFLPLDADDRIEPTMIEACLRVLEARPRLGFAFTHLRLFGEEQGVYKQPPYNFYRQLLSNGVSVCALVRKQAWVEAGGYNEAMILGAADWDFWIACGERGWHGALVPEPLFCYRVRQGSMYSRTRQRLEQCRQMIHDQHPELFSKEGLARVQRAWYPLRWMRFLDPHSPQSLLAVAARKLPAGAVKRLEKAYNAWLR
jgi:glycosyltransferase involved in cell wall biosynthesis